MIWLIEIGLAIVIFILMVIFHELGHILMLYLCNGEIPSIYFTGRYIEIGEIRDYIFLQRYQYNWILFTGVLLGFIPFLFLGIYVNVFLVMILLVSYVAGCKEDLKNVIYD